MISADPNNSEGRILPFRRRGPALSRHIRPPSTPVPDLDKYERIAEEPGEYRHRMILNGLGLAVTVVLIVAGLWIADVMAHIQKSQDCVLIGRTNCGPIDAGAQQR